MADTSRRDRRGPLVLRAESGDLLLPQDVASEMENMYLTNEGTLRSVWGPAPYVPRYGYTTESTYQGYGTVHGIFHARLGNNGEQDVLLAQWNNTVYVFEGWNARQAAGPWTALAGDAATSPSLVLDLDVDDRPRFPPQWEVTPKGIVIIPKGEATRPLFYDGTVVLPLGYDKRPGAPDGLGPLSGGATSLFWIGFPRQTASPFNAVATSNYGGYSGARKLGFRFGRGRLGTTGSDGAPDSVAIKGRIYEGSYRCKVQWVDRWGNLSPLSGASTPLEIPRSGLFEDIDNFQTQVMWTGIAPGPEGTIGRQVYRTKDELNSDTTDFFRIPSNAAGGFLAFSTLPDNIVVDLPDNCPDAWLEDSPDEVVPVIPFKLYKTAFGRGWAANFDNDPGRVHPTIPGKWGTFELGKEIYPDPRGAEITGLYPVPQGLLAFTATTTFLIAFNDFARDEFQVTTVHPSIGCVAPSSLAVMPDGKVIWLGIEGFYTFDGTTVVLVSKPVERQLRRINRAREIQAVGAYDVVEKKYRCWVAMEASKDNDVCWEYDGQGWTHRTDVKAADVCVTQDHRNYMLVGGKAEVELARVVDPAQPTLEQQGVWLLDHQVPTWEPASRTAEIKTSWIRGPDSQGRASPMTVYLWFRETEATTMTVEVERDWRTDIKYTTTVPLTPQDDGPAIWGTTSYGGNRTNGVDPAIWDRRRPYWTRADIFVPSCEAFRLRLTHTGDWEFLGLSVDEVPHPDTFRSYPK